MEPRLTIAEGTRVLLFGDSFVDAGFAQRMRVLVEQRGGKLFSDAWTSSTTKMWATKDRLGKLLAATKPDVIMVALGANEVLYAAPENCAPNVRAIVLSLHSKSCVWVSPPLWKGETGIVKVERDNAGPCRFFDSSALKLDKQTDGIHPSLKGGTAWADAVWEQTIAPAPVPSPSIANVPLAPSATPADGTAF
ncbi:MAG: hypothetical protein NVS3B20_07770 [Polyangiales bacterium]